MGITVLQNGKVVEVAFQNRVVAIKRYLARKNVSDTLDVSDYQTVEVVKALVWLGQENFPPTYYDYAVEPKIRYPHTGYEKRELEPIEQFAWVDCSNIFIWRGAPELRPEVDEGSQLDPEAAAMYPLWQSFVQDKIKLLTEQINKRNAEIAAAKAAEMEKKMKKAEKLESTRAAANADYDKLPPIGTAMEVDGFTGRLFWKAVKPFRGKYKARIGLRDVNGFVKWVDADKLNLVGK